jgi:hypothetical protein
MKTLPALCALLLSGCGNAYWDYCQGKFPDTNSVQFDQCFFNWGPNAGAPQYARTQQAPVYIQQQAAAPQRMSTQEYQLGLMEASRMEEPPAAVPGYGVSSHYMPNPASPTPAQMQRYFMIKSQKRPYFNWGDAIGDALSDYQHR